MTPIYPPDRLRGPDPTAPVWAVARGFVPQSHYVVTETWADLASRYSASEIAARGMTQADADALALRLNDPMACGCEVCTAPAQQEA